MPGLFELSEMVLDEISLCPSGDNVGAQVVLSKADPEDFGGLEEMTDDPYEEGDEEDDDPDADDEDDDHGEGEDLDTIQLQALAKLSSRSMPSLERKKGKNDNWVESAGGLPDYIERIAKHLHYEKGMDIGHAIATAVNQCKKWAAGGGGVAADTVAKAAAAIAEWNAKKGKAKVSKQDWIFEDLEKGEQHPFVNHAAKKPGKKTCDKCGKVASAHDKKKVYKTLIDGYTTSKSQELGNESDTLDHNDPHQEDKQVPEIKKDDLPAEVVTYIETLEDKFEAVSTELAGLKTQVGKSGDDAVSKSEDDKVAEAIAKADPVIRALIEKAQKEAEDANVIAKAERSQRIEREMIAKAEALPMLTEDRTELASILREISEKLDPATVTKIETVLKAANTQIAKSGMFDTIGRPGGAVTIAKSVEAAAEELRKSNPALTAEQAQALVYANDPTLYDAELQEAK